MVRNPEAFASYRNPDPTELADPQVAFGSVPILHPLGVQSKPQSPVPQIAFSLSVHRTEGHLDVSGFRETTQLT